MIDTVLVIIGVGMALAGAYFSANHKCKHGYHPNRRKTDRK